MSQLNAERFYSQANEAPQQGDILIGAVARVISDDAFSPARWVMLDDGAHPLAEADAVAQAEGRTDLDRNFTVSPLVRPDKVLVAGEPVDQGLLMGGHIVGYLSVPALVVNGMEIIPESVVDLSYRTTLDRLAYTQRITCVSEEARERLRFALARLDVLRTPNLEIELSAAVGQEIKSAKVSRKNPLIVELVLGDGSKVHLLKTPGSPEPSPRARTSSSVRGGRSS